MSATAYYPEEDLMVVALQNTVEPPLPLALADKLARLVIGPGEEPRSGTYDGDLSQLTGRYGGPTRGGHVTLQIRAAEDQLIVSERPWAGGEPDTLRHVSGRTWQAGSNLYLGLYGHTLFRFVRSDGQIDELRLDEVSGHYVLRRVGAP